MDRNGREIVMVQEPESSEIMELPTLEGDNTLLLDTLISAFPGAQGLKYKTETGTFRALLNKDSKFYAPTTGWAGKTFIVILNKPANPYLHVQKPLPTAAQLSKYQFYILENGNKSCVISIDPHFLVTFRHGSHMSYTKGTELEVISEETEAKHKVVVSYVSRKFDVVLLKSQVNIIDLGPHIASAITGEKILVIGYGNDYKTPSYLTGCLHLNESVVFQGTDTEAIGPFMLGTVPTSRGDSGASCWSSNGLIGINLGCTNMPSKTHYKAIEEAAVFQPKNYMVAIERIIQFKKDVEDHEQRTSNRLAAYVISVEGEGLFESV